MEQVQQPTTDPPQDRTFSRATVNCTKNCPTCDQDLTIFLWTILSLWTTFSFLPVSLASFSFPILPASIGFVSTHSTFETGSFETTFPLSLDCIHFISITLLVLLALVRFTLGFLCFSFRDVRAHLRCIHWDWSCGLCGSVECSWLYSLVA